MQPTHYPVDFSVEYPLRNLNKMSSCFRPVFAIPVFFLLVLLQNRDIPTRASEILGSALGVFDLAGLVTIPVALMILLRGSYPRWWFDWNIELARFVNRVLAYMLLLTDRYPAIEAEQTVRLTYPDPKAEGLNRILPLVKWLLAIPHYVVLVVLLLAMPMVWIAAWVSILSTGRYPLPLFRFMEGWMRWSNRVTAYAFTLVTDKYPPLRLTE